MASSSRSRWRLGHGNGIAVLGAGLVYVLTACLMGVIPGVLIDGATGRAVGGAAFNGRDGAPTNGAPWLRLPLARVLFAATFPGEGHPSTQATTRQVQEDEPSDQVTMKKIRKKLWPKEANGVWEGNFCQWFGVTCDKLLVETISLSNQSLTGKIPTEFEDLLSLSSLDLSNNGFIGPVPEQLVERNHNGSLVLNLVNNPELCDPTPAGLMGPSMQLCANNGGWKRQWKSWYTIVISILSVILIILVLGIFVFIVRWKREEKYQIMPMAQAHRGGHSGGGRHSQSQPRNSSSDGSGGGRKVLCFSLKELRTATRDFNPANMLGSGMHGATFKGKLRSRSIVAVKRYGMQSTALAGSPRDFKKEMEVYFKLRHNHLLELIGYCATSKERLVVYEYSQHRSIFDHLQGKRRPILSWRARLEILIGVGRALSYMHRCTPPVPHKNVKSTNILLFQPTPGGPWQGKIGDFGRKDDGAMGVTARGEINIMIPQAAFGYVDPEFPFASERTPKSDVFCFGIVLMEAITGQKPFDQQQNPPDLMSRFRGQVEASGVAGMEELLDTALQEQSFSRRGLRLLGNLALKCVAVQGSNQPEMREVARTMQKILKLEDTPLAFHGNVQNANDMTPERSPSPSPMLSPHQTPGQGSPRSRSPNRHRSRHRVSPRPPTPVRPPSLPDGIPMTSPDDWNRRPPFPSDGVHIMIPSSGGNERYPEPFPRAMAGLLPQETLNGSRSAAGAAAGLPLMFDNGRNSADFNGDNGSGTFGAMMDLGLPYNDVTIEMPMPAVTPR